MVREVNGYRKQKVIENFQYSIFDYKKTKSYRNISTSNLWLSQYRIQILSKIFNMIFTVIEYKVIAI